MRFNACNEYCCLDFTADFEVLSKVKNCQSDRRYPGGLCLECMPGFSSSHTNLLTRLAEVPMVSAFGYSVGFVTDAEDEFKASDA
jgi:hypothetical protein